MKVGLTYDLRDEYRGLDLDEEDLAEFDSPQTIEALEKTLRSLGYETERIGHGRNLVKLLAEGRRWDLVFNIAEGLYGYGREALIPALLEAYGMAYTFSDPLTLSVALHKGLSKRLVRDLGLPTPDFLVVENEAEAAAVALPFPLFAKPVAEGTGKGVNSSSKIGDRGQLLEVCGRLLRRYRQPVLVETFLPGREFTVGILGTGAEAEVLGILEVVLRTEAEAEVYSFVNKEKCEDLVDYLLVDDEQAHLAAKTALAAYRGLGCRDGGRVDLRADARGQPSFMEINPLAGLHPTHSDLPILGSLVGVEYQELIDRIVRSALKRSNNHQVRC
ncbi:MAG: D-alanine--D-alanine ligase [Thermodesulfobacteriota bacterium]